MSTVIASCRTAAACDRSCVTCGQTGKYVLLKDCSPAKTHAYLLLPASPIDETTQRIKIEGIESPEVLSPRLDDMWDRAWKESLNLHDTSLLPHSPARTGLAVNSTCGRTHTPLHIHISCVHADVQLCLACNRDRIASDLKRPSKLSLRGHHYEVVRVSGLTGKSSPFEFAERLATTAHQRGDESVAVIGSRNRGEYYVLDTYCHDGNPGHAETLLDQNCSDPALPWPQTPPLGKTTCDDDCFP
jgi:CDP-diacylglycerol pyrophosphatase